jgi:hypothetical protein
VSIADSLPCVTAWKTEPAMEINPSPPFAPEQACPNTCTGPKYNAAQILSLTAPPSSPKEQEAAVRLIQREILRNGPVPAIITETPEALYEYKPGSVFSWTKPANQPAAAKPKEGEGPDLSSLFTTSAHAVSIVGWGTANGQDYWKIENS